MTFTFAQGWRTATYWVVVSASFVAILAIDLLLPYGYISAALYVVPVFLTVLTGRAAWVVRTTIAAIVATSVGFANASHSSGATDANGHAYTRATIIVMILAVGTLGSLLIVRSNRLSAVAGELSSTSAELGNQARLARAASQVGKVAGWTLDREEGSPVIWSDDVERIFGTRAGRRTVRDDVLALIDDAADRDRLLEAGLTCLRDGTPFIETFRATKEAGGVVWVTVMGEARRDDSGYIAGLVGAVQDVTLWKEAEEAATAQSRRFAEFAKAVPAVVWTAEPSGDVDYFNDALVEYTGLPADALLSDAWLAAIHPDDAENALQEWRYALATGAPYSTAYRLRGADGEYRWFRVAARAELGDAGQVIKWWGSAVDVHDTRRLEQEAKRLADDRSEILESIGDGVVTLNPESRITYLNTTAEKLVRRRAADLLGRAVSEAFPEIRDIRLNDAFAAAAASGEPRRIELYLASLETWFEVNITQTRQGRTLYVRDVTEVKAIREQLAQSQRLESVGRLTGGVAHDFNNLLTVVVGGTEALEGEPGLSEVGREMLGLVARAAARGAELTHHLLAFSRLQPLAPQLVDVSRRIGEMTPILTRAIGRGVEVITEFGEDLPPALVDPGQLENALLNLAINAGDAMKSGGTLTIAAEFVHLDEAYSTLHAEVLPGDYVLISVRDTGTGIAAKHLPRVFEPFYTTKPAGEGSGLGLSMVWGFAKQTGGHVTVYSEEGLGSTFRLYLPVATEEVGAPDTSAPYPPTPSSGSGHILLAEDDPLVRQFAADRLRDHGFTVTVAGTGPEALELLTGIDDLALLFTDVIMVGGVSGRELAAEVVAIRPGTPVLYASGYTEDLMVHQGRLDPEVALLEKPYTGTQLIDRIHAVLGGEGMGEVS